MLRTIDVLMICALIAAATWTFKVKHDSELAVERIAELEQRIQAEREAIDILRADWSLLNSPDRLQRLIDRHAEELGLEPLRPERIITIDEVPLRTGPSDAKQKQAFSDAISTNERVVTGSIQAPSPSEGTKTQRTALPPLEPRQ